MKKPNYTVTFTSKSFQDAFEYYLTVSTSNKEAYEMAEKEHIKLCGVNKYTGYECFRRVRTYHFKKKK